MKKLLRFADMIILVCATIGMMLQLWIHLTGPNEQDLYPAHHPGWTTSVILTLCVLVFTWVVTRQVGNHQGYKANFPPSIPAALGCLGAVVAFGYTGMQQLQNSILWLDTLIGLLGLLSAIGLLLVAFCRWKGHQPPFLSYAIPCVFLSLYVFSLGREMGGEPEAVRYLFRFLATLSLIPACYQLWGFSVSSGNRNGCLFWCLLAGYLCIMSAPAGEGGLMYMLWGIWMLTNPCSLQYLIRRTQPEEPAQPEETTEEISAESPEIPCTTEEDPQPMLQPEEVSQSQGEEQPELDVDAIIAEILQEIDSNIT